MGSCCDKEKEEGTGAKVHSNQRPQSQQEEASQPSLPTQTENTLQPSLPLQTINTSPDQLAPQEMETHRPPSSPLKPSHPVSSPHKLAQSYHTILGKPLEDVHNYFTLGKELGQGQFGATYFCTEKATGQSYACKSISKCRLVPMKDRENVKREIQIMQQLTGQPNVVKFKCAYEDELSVHIVMELCAGGELFDRIIAMKHYSECAAASICREIASVINTCHFMGVMHRDIKPENFLFAAKGKGATLKAIDFGLSVFIEEGKAYRDIVGSAYYVAPEVLKCSYGKEIDIWSAGIILYILLSGAPPFWAETEKGIFDAILQRDVDLERAPWPSISNSAKDLLRKMLTRDPKKRITSAQVLAHPWVREGGGASYEPVHSAVLSRMKQFRSMNKLKELALKVIAENIYKEESKGLKQIFAMNTDKSGSITFEELKTGLRRLGSKLSDAEVKKLMDAADVDGSGTIDYIGFITATMHRHRLEREENLCRAFQYFDKDKSGYITRDALETAMKDHGMSDSAVIDEIMGLINKDNDERINYEEFCTMIRSGH